MASPVPTIIDRHTWGAATPSQPIQILNQTPTAIVIHHTADANTLDFSREHALSYARSLQKDHMTNPIKKYADSGQHFTITRGGWILEGRQGSLAALQAGNQHVVGAQVSSHNDTLGIENEGNYSHELPPFQLQYSLVLLCAYICRQYGLKASSIVGHRDFKDNRTPCPGQKFYDDLDNLRLAVSVCI
jgi:N-acetyl-anhydromuramyl-L-alanine amidase AmpD